MSKGKATYWPQRIRSFYNGARWGSAQGPAIEISPVPESITFHRMPARRAARLMTWVMAGMSEGGDSMGKHEKPGAPDQGSGKGGGGAHEKPSGNGNSGGSGGSSGGK